MLIIGNSTGLINDVMTLLKDKVELQDLGNVSDFLGVDMVRKPGILLCLRVITCRTSSKNAQHVWLQAQVYSSGSKPVK